MIPGGPIKKDSFPLSGIETRTFQPIACSLHQLRHSSRTLYEQEIRSLTYLSRPSCRRRLVESNIGEA